MVNRMFWDAQESIKATQRVPKDIIVFRIDENKIM